jgi:hypothetical protein
MEVNQLQSKQPQKTTMMKAPASLQNYMYMGAHKRGAADLLGSPINQANKPPC